VVLVELSVGNSDTESSQPACFVSISHDSSFNHSVLGKA
jgi:hypothetical protein